MVEDDTYIGEDAFAPLGFDPDNPTGFDPKYRPHYMPQMRWSVLERNRGPHNDVMCSCCKKPITREQVVTIHHIKPWSVLQDELLAMRKYQNLPPELQAKVRSDVFNDVAGGGANLTPLHVSCHVETDTGRTVDDPVTRELMDAGYSIRLPKLEKPKSVKPLPDYIPSIAEQDADYKAAAMLRLHSHYNVPEGVRFPENMQDMRENRALLINRQRELKPKATNGEPMFTDGWRMRIALEEEFMRWKERVKGRDGNVIAIAAE